MKLVTKEQAEKLKKWGFNKSCVFRQYTGEPFIQLNRSTLTPDITEIDLLSNSDDQVDLAIPDYQVVINWFIDLGYVPELLCHGKGNFNFNIYSDYGKDLMHTSDHFKSYDKTEDAMVAYLIDTYDKIQTEQISDGHHTFKELYDYRMMYNALLFNEWSKKGLYNVHKSYHHYDGELCFGDDKWFIVVAELPTGSISNHYKREYWNLFKVPEVEKSTTPYDGHTPQDALERMNKFLKSCL